MTFIPPSVVPDFQRRRLLATSVTLASGLLVAGSAADVLAQDIRFAARSRVVETRSGRVQGAHFANGVDAFYGLPYGASTAGDGRFMAPRREAAWSGIRDALTVGNRSPQTLSGPLSEISALDRAEPLGEDCLNLNVFTPGADGRKRPVMVWLHGGGYTSGSGGWILYNGIPLAASEDVVVVTVTHRLNVFGHLHLAELGGERFADSGNNGMLDIVAALEWVRDNIEQFGGDASNVTIFGQSGGAGKVSTLMAMPSARGLFHRAIAMSGSNLSGISADNATATAERLMAALDLNSSQVDRLHRMPMQQLLGAFLNIPGIQMGPVLDGRNLPSGPFSPRAPAISATIPMMLGTTEHEVNFLPNTPLDPIDETELLQRVRQTLNIEDVQARNLLGVYRSGRPDVSNVELFQIIASDNSFRRGVIAQAELQARQQGAPVYLYYFRWQSPVREGKLRAYHCLDIPFAFNNVDECAAMVGAGQNRYALATAMSSAFAAFARTGNPNNANIPHWAPFDPEGRATMVMDDEVVLRNDPFGDERRVLYGVG